MESEDELPDLADTEVEEQEAEAVGESDTLKTASKDVSGRYIFLKLDRDNYSVDGKKLKTDTSVKDGNARARKLKRKIVESDEESEVERGQEWSTRKNHKMKKRQNCTRKNKRMTDRSPSRRQHDVRAMIKNSITILLKQTDWKRKS